MKISIEDILKYDPFGEENWDEIESHLYKLYFQNGKMNIDYIGECCDKVCDGLTFPIVSVDFSDNVDKSLVIRTYKRFYGGFIDNYGYSIDKINQSIETIQDKYEQNKKILSELKSNEMGIVDLISNDVKIGRIKHIRGNRWIVSSIDRIPSLSDEEFTKLKEDGFFLKGYRYYVYNYNKKIDNIFLKNIDIFVKDSQNRILRIKKTIKKLKNNLENFNFDILDTVLIKKT